MHPKIGIMRRISLLRRRRYHPSFIRRRTAKRKRKNRHYGRPFSNPSHEARSGFPKTCPCNLQRNADFKCFLRRNNLAGSFPYPTADAQPHTAVRIQRRCQPPHQNRTLLKAQTICRLVHLCEQFPPSICQNTREKRLCQRPFPGRRH